MREVGQGTRFDLAVFAVGFAEEDGRRGVAIGHGGHVHAYIVSQLIRQYKRNIPDIHAYKTSRKYFNPLGTKDFL
jgi:hypothetical protein